ncbi:MAG: phosphomannomutase/phosphoglucomutase [Spirochaetales bacterium]|nr:phosphomannomutase/phosphoglucomutase [Spirochaetales bacterium]
MGAFHAYDIRGIYGQDVSTDLAYALGRAFAVFINKDAILVGYDARLYSKQLYDSVIEGLLDEGVNVIGIGLSSTPQMHFLQMLQKCGAGIMVTASHNPKEYHGFKFFDESGGSVSYAKGLNKIEEMIEHITEMPKKSRGTLVSGPTMDSYINFLAAVGNGKKNDLKLVIDTANGSSGPVFRKLVERLGLNAVIINEEPDGNFPNHDPNPLKEESRIQIKEAVLGNNARFGVIMDGDGDRIIFVDEAGKAIENYFISALIAEKLLENTPGASIVYDLISSKVLAAHITNKGGIPEKAKVGYTFIYDKMVETGAVFGAETSGHVYFKVDDSYYTESAAYAMMIMLSLLSEKNVPLSELVAPLSAQFYQAKEVNMQVADKSKALAMIEKTFSDALIDKLDGVSVEYPDFWFNVRPSNTEPLLRVRLEGKDKGTADAALAKIEDLLKHV